MMQSIFIGIFLMMISCGPGISLSQAQGEASSTQPNDINAVGADNASLNSIGPSTESSQVSSDSTAINSLENAPLNKSLDVFEAKSKDIVDVLKMIEEKSGLKVIVPDQAKGQVTIYLKNVDVRDLLRVVLEPLGFAYYEQEQGRSVKVVSLDDFKFALGYSFEQDVQTKILPLVSIDPKQLLPLLNPMRSVLGKIFYDEKSHNLILIDSKDPLEAMVSLVRELDVPIETEIFALQNAKGVDVIKHVEPLITKSIGRVEYDRRSNNIVVTDTRAKINKITDLIKTLDAQNKGIEVELKVVQIVLNAEHPSGVDWDAIVSNYQQIAFNQTTLVNNVLGEGNRPIFLGEVVPPNQEGQSVKSDALSLGTLSQEDFVVLEDALDTVGRVLVISKSNVMAPNNKPSQFTSHLQDITAVPKEGERLFDKAQDIYLYLMPTINPDDTLTLKLRPGIIIKNSIDLLDSMRKGDRDKKEGSVLLNIANGSTVVIGGLFRDVQMDSMKKIPLLGDLPVLGTVFRKPGKRFLKTEIIIFVTVKKNVDEATVP